MTSRRAGRDLYALGSNPEAATLFGLSERRLTLNAFVTSGALAGLGGLVYLSIYATGDARVGTGYELEAVAAAVVGGVAIIGGSGTIWGVALGAFFLATISSALPVLGVPSLWQQAIVGIFIVGAILLDRAAVPRPAYAARRGREVQHERPEHGDPRRRERRGRAAAARYRRYGTAALAPAAAAHRDRDHRRRSCC